MDNQLFPHDVIEPIAAVSHRVPDGEIWLVCGYYRRNEKWGYRQVTNCAPDYLYHKSQEYREAAWLPRASMVAEVMETNGWTHLRIVSIPLIGDCDALPTSTGRL